MAFHRLTVPSYPGGLRGGDDYVNNAVSGTPAPADSALGGGTYAGSYFFGQGEAVTGAGINRGFKALAQNCDFLDDAMEAAELAITGLLAADIALAADYNAQIAQEIQDRTNDVAAEALARAGADDLLVLTADRDRLRILTGAATLHSPSRDSTLILNPGGVAFSITLPDPSTCNGWRVCLFNGDGFPTPVTLARDDVGDKVNNLAEDYVLNAAFGRWLLVSDGTNWHVW